MAEPLSLESHEIGGQPLIAPFLDRLGLRTFFEGALGEADRRLRLSHTKTALLMIRNFTLSRHPLYAVPQWLSRFDPGELGACPRKTCLAASSEGIIA